MRLRKSACMKILALLCVYLILAGVVSSVDAVLMFVYLAYKIDLLTAAVIGVPLVLILIGDRDYQHTSPRGICLHKAGLHQSRNCAG